MRFSLASVPAYERATTLREMGRRLFNLDFESLAHEPVMEADVWILPGLAVTRARQSSHIITRFDPSREDDDFILVWADEPSLGRVNHSGQEIDGNQEAALLISCADPFRAEARSEFRATNLQLKRALLTPLLRDAEDRLMRPIPPSNSAMRLLKAYLDAVLREGVIDNPELGHAAALHICDLIALALGTDRDAAAFAAERGGRAARLAAVKHWALARLSEPGLGVRCAASAHGVTPRYIQLLFESQGMTFSAFVLRERLELARRQLGNPLLAQRPISAIAYDSGFGDLSYFNRVFRRTFGETPSDARHRAPAR